MNNILFEISRYLLQPSNLCLSVSVQQLLQ